ncbi:AAA family ATPase [Pseudomonas aeruginosa]|nr:AAA family ATPase [Pseudomonas aeruginosa]
MQYIDRPSQPPAILSSPLTQASRKALLEFWQLEPVRRSQTSVPSIAVNQDEHLLREALANLNGQRCAFCEASDRLEVHRFRPAGNALPMSRSSDAHLYYLWLADAWQNLLPICHGCVPIEPRFPVRGRRCELPTREQVEAYVKSGDGLWRFGMPSENAELLDPTEVGQFASHLTPLLDGILLPGSKRGALTIAHFDLNRNERRHQRYFAYQKSLDELRSCGMTSDLSRIDQLVDFASLEFGGTWYLLLRRLLNHLPVNGIGRNLTPKQIGPALRRWAKATDAAALLSEARQMLQRKDAKLHANGSQAIALVPIIESVTAIHIRNFKAIEQLDLKLKASPARSLAGTESLAAALVILGENATGKSSILEAVALTLVPAAVRNALNLPLAELVMDPAQLGVDGGDQATRAQIRIELTNQHWVELTIDQHAHVLTSNFDNQHVPVFAYGAFRRFTRASPRTTLHAHVRNLFDGNVLSNPERWLSQLRQDRFDMVIRTLREVLAIDGDFDVIQRTQNSDTLYMVTSVSEPDGTLRFNRTPLHAVSSGYRSMLAMICDILKGLLNVTIYPGFESFQAARGVVLIDEIEAHLHPRWKVQVMSRLRAALPSMTFIVTTHDPLCLRGTEQGEVAVLQRIASTDGQAQRQMPITIESMADLPPVADLRLEQLLTSDFFQMLSTDDAHADRRLARIADLMAAHARGELSSEDERVLQDFNAEITNALPIGSSEIHQIVQLAVGEYLAKRRAASSQRLRDLRRAAKDQILAALERL